MIAGMAKLSLGGFLMFMFLVPGAGIAHEVGCSPSKAAAAAVQAEPPEQSEPAQQEEASAPKAEEKELEGHESHSTDSPDDSPHH